MVGKQKSKIIRNSNEEWDLILTPKNNLLSFPVKEIWHYKGLMWLFVKRDFIAQYKQTILGPVWHVVQPALTTIIYLLIFNRIANIPTDGINPILFYMAGITLWNYFSLCLTQISNTFISNAGIFGKVYFPRIVLPISVILSNLIRFGIQYLLLFGAMCYFHFNQSPLVVTISWVFIPVLLALVGGIALGIGIIVSSLTTKYRDFSVLLSFMVQLGMYATPIVYPLSFLKGKPFEWVIVSNPLSPLIEAYRYCLFGKGTFDINLLTYSIVFTIVTIFVGLIFFHKVEKSFMDTV